MLKKLFGKKEDPASASVTIQGSTWGTNDDFTIAAANVVVLRRMRDLLLRAESIALVWVIVSTALIALFLNYALFMKSFETVIFSDGTELVCVMQGKDARVAAYDQFGRRLKTLLWLGN